MIIPVGISLANSSGIISVLFPIAMLLIVGGGEVCINATNYALVGNLIQPKHQGLFTGYFFVSIAMGVVASGPIANYAIGNKLHAHEITALGTNHLYTNIFLSLALLSGVVATIYFLISKKINNVFDAHA